MTTIAREDHAVMVGWVPPRLPKKRGIGWGPYGGRLSILVRRLSYLRWLGNSPDPAESPTRSVAAPSNCRINVPSCDRPSRARTARCWWGRQTFAREDRAVLVGWTADPASRHPPAAERCAHRSRDA